MSRPLKRKPTPPWWNKPKAITRFGILDPNLRRQVFARAGGECECCGDRLRQVWEAHHRKFRSRGGQDSIVNLAALCLLCHRRIHNHDVWATEHGYSVPSTEDPASVPMALHGVLFRLLTADGGYLEVAS